ncbi:PREDICTED: DNA-directed RNA polymerase I subunit RPA12-like isoform 2 [Fragaria vesca subsp. vesca]|uniref:DNA-directed RNA polymerase I subunit RPA12-like isoform X1 n=2 Tax=Fragaria vesca subsp. vesca TaxID=101020 RepID=UPI0002C33C57|nr:PREDICTED: DNA-directed RNA polymerase I subunit RPA12-like isoform X1 [Fragaria vesca subsp. vesca]
MGSLSTMASMENSRDFMFCNICGTMLSFTRTLYAEPGQCPKCKFSRPIKELSKYKISYTVSKEDIQRELGISKIKEEKTELAKTDMKKCEKCGHNEHTYFSRQMRSADEGATTFYTCTKCNNSFSEN